MLEIQTCSKGAELVSAKINGRELIHDGQNFWNRHSPILFPIVGKLKNGKTVIDGKEYEMSQHGFARDVEFKKIGENSYVLEYSEETLKKYPFKFQLYISYEINGNVLKVKYRVVNVDDKDIYFGIGGHPAFKCDYSNKDVFLQFECNEPDVQVYQLEDGLVNPKVIDGERFIDKNIMRLYPNVFDNDAIILKNLKSNRVKLFEENTEKLEFDFSGFKYLGIWSKPGADFVCIEPWFNTADLTDATGKFIDKPDLICVEKMKDFNTEYKICFK